MKRQSLIDRMGTTMIMGLFLGAVAVSTATAGAIHGVNVDFNGGAGTYSGQAVLDVSADHWNGFNPESTSSASELVDSQGNPTEVGWSLDSGVRSYNGKNGAGKLLDDWGYMDGSRTLTVTGLDPDARYDLVIFSQGNSSGAGGQFTLNGTTKKAEGDKLGDSNFTEGGNYVHFETVTPDSGGELVLTWKNPHGRYSVLNGFQIRRNLPEDEAALAQLATQADKYGVRLAAAKKVSDKDFVSVDHRDPAVREAAVLQITDQEVLARVATQDDHENVRAAAVKKLNPDTAAVRDIALNDESLRVRLQAVKGLTDQELLGDIALNADKEAVRVAATEKLDPDSEALRKVAFNATSVRVQRAAFRKTTGARMLLGDVAGEENWSGFSPAPGEGPKGADAGRLEMPGTAEFRYSDEGWIEPQGFRRRRNPAGGWRDWPILALDIKTPDHTESVQITLSILGGKRFVKEMRQDVTLQVAGEGWQTVYVPLEDFRLNEMIMPVYLSSAEGIRVQAQTANEGGGELLLSNVRLQRGRNVGLMVPVKSKPGDPGETIEYEGTVVNCSAKPQAVELRLEREGGDVMVTTVEPQSLRLAPGESREVVVRAEIPTRETPGVSGKLPEGAREHWTLSAVPNGRGELSEDVELIHVVRMEPPYIRYSWGADWDKIRKLAETEDWAAEQAQHYIENTPKNGAFAWQLTREKKYAEQAAEELRKFAADYPQSMRVSSGSFVQEGHAIRKLAEKYDLIRDSGVFTEEEKQKIEHAFRLYTEIARDRQSGVGNWDVAVRYGALYAALILQDWNEVAYALEGPGGIYQQISVGIMDDGWWWEMSTNYNYGVGRNLTQTGLALRPWGVEMLEERFPASYHNSVTAYSTPGEPEKEFKNREGSGVFAAKWGPTKRNYRQIRDLWDCLIPMINEDGMAPGLNDAPPEREAGTGGFTIAAYAYDDPEYLRRASSENLFYPIDASRIEKAKEGKEDKLLPSAVADNAGVAMLRSQGVDSPHEQYQALLSYGSHGANHGHWNRLNLTYLRRFGKLATSSRTAWFSYGNFMYRMYVQTSMAHSMVVVDGKNQYPAPSVPLLEHTGDLFQAVAVQNTSRWTNIYADKASEKEREKGVMERSGHTVEIPEDPPKRMMSSGATEPVRSRRLMAVTDEYVLVLDHVKGEKEHTYDLLYQFPTFSNFADQDDIEFIKEKEKLDDSSVRAGQFVYNPRFYEAKGPVRATFVSHHPPTEETPYRNTYSWPARIDDLEDAKEEWGMLNIDVYTGWPQQRQHIVADNPQRFTTYSAARVEGKEASFVSLIELQEDKSNRQVENLSAEGLDKIRVELTNGRVHHWQVSGLEAEKTKPDVRLQLTAQGADGTTHVEKTKTE